LFGNESRSAERCAHKIAQDETPLVVGQFTSDGDSAASIGFERGQQTHSTVYVENQILFFFLYIKYMYYLKKWIRMWTLDQNNRK
jgi:hypothetical protein